MKHSAKWLVAPIAALALVVAGCASPDPDEGQEPAAANSDQGDITELVEAAKKEGKVTWLTGMPQGFATATAAAFKEEFGIDVEYVSLSSGILKQRYKTEAEAGALSGDVVIANHMAEFADEAIEKGWAIPIKDAGLPVVELGEYPEDYWNDGVMPIVAVTPFQIIYNTSALSGDDIPESFADYTDPKYKDKLILVDPSNADSQVAHYNALLEEYGEEWFEGIRANNAKFFPTVSGGAQAMVAGEGALTYGVVSVTTPLKEAGAPIDVRMPPVTTGGLQGIILTAPEYVQHPNAAKLFVNWWLSESGNLAANGTLAVSPFNQDEMPSGFQKGAVVTPEMKAKILKLLGIS